MRGPPEALAGLGTAALGLAWPLERGGAYRWHAEQPADIMGITP